MQLPLLVVKTLFPSRHAPLRLEAINAHCAHVTCGEIQRSVRDYLQGNRANFFEYQKHVLLIKKTYNFFDLCGPVWMQLRELYMCLRMPLASEKANILVRLPILLHNQTLAILTPLPVTVMLTSTSVYYKPLRLFPCDPGSKIECFKSTGAPRNITAP